MQDLSHIFHPRSLAVVGVSNDPTKVMGQIYLASLLRLGFDRERLYPINPNGGEAQGLKVYPSIKDVSGPLDYVVSCIGAQSAPRLIEDCVAKEVKTVSLFTAGFSETGAEEGRQREAKLVQIARQGGVRILGPNCMGVYCPSGRVSFAFDFPQEKGPVAFISQSGGNSFYFVRAAANRGIRFSKVVSYGNACDINETDLLEYLTHDPETKLITAYIEGTKDGVRFFRVLRDTAKAKPVIILKGGITDGGSRAAATHTGSLAGSSAHWDAAIKQAGAIRVYDLDEMVDVAVSLLYMRAPRGRNVAVVGLGGGASVQATDDCERAGLHLPALASNIQDQLLAFIPEQGSMFRNPIDAQIAAMDPEGFSRTIRVVASWQEVDAVIAHIASGLTPYIPDAIDMLNTMLEGAIACYQQIDKAMAIAIHSFTSAQGCQGMFEAQQRCYEAGVPVFHSVGKAASAIYKYFQYQEQRGI